MIKSSEPLIYDVFKFCSLKYRLDDDLILSEGTAYGIKWVQTSAVHIIEMSVSHML